MNVSNWIGLGFIVLLVLGALFTLSRLGKPYEVSVEEFERRAKEGPGLINAGMIGLQKILDPATAKAVEAQEDLRQGRFNEKEGEGDPPEPGADNREKENT